MKRDRPSPPTCEGCGNRELALVLFNVYFGGKLQLHCTNCVLKNHRGLFCPICFQVYQKPPPTHLRSACVKCPAIAHRSCVVSASSSGSLSPAFQCPTCVDPTFEHFSFRYENSNKKDERKPGGNGNGDKPGRGGELVTVSSENGENRRFIDVGMAKVLVAAAQIAAAKMSRAAKEARERASELALVATKARKEAKEKLELTFALEAKETESNGVDRSARYINDGIIVVSEANNGSQNWNQMRAGRSIAIRRDGVLPAIPSVNDVFVSGIGSDRRLRHMKDGGTGKGQN